MISAVMVASSKFQHKNEDYQMNDTELKATLDDMQDQLTYLFRLHGPATWKHILKQRKDNAPKPLPTSHHPSHGQSNKPLAT
jgi:hypothetical protein